MVCVPCFIIPLLLYIWHKFVQPFMLRYWNPWEKKDAQGNVIKAAAPEFPFECKGGVCPFPGAKNKKQLEDGAATAEAPTTQEGEISETPAAAAATTAVGDDVNSKKEN